MGLGKYFKKRNFRSTPEPKGAVKQSRPHRLVFVVQEHHATTLHYDFRLEIDGVLKSWAVPKGPSLDPHQHHLAIHTEDHPYDYRNFEGVIPEDNYGAGNVIIWDEGWYEARASGADNEKTLREEYHKGHLTFVLHGQKLQGEFALIKMHSNDDKAWLLIKKGDKFASTSDVTKQDESVRSHRHVDDLGAKNKLPDLSAYPRVAEPWTVKPMLCTLVEEPFSKPGWFFEIKWDGWRAIGSKHGHEIGLYSRNHIDFRETFPIIYETMRSFKHDVIVDGEIVVVDEEGKSHFEWLQDLTPRSKLRGGPGSVADGHGALHYYLFDILWCDGRDLRIMPLRERKQLLKILMPENDALRYSDDIETNGEALFKQMQERNLEGMVAKQADSAYREGDRGPAWLKVKTHLRQEVVIGGYTEPRGGRKYLGALVVGVYDHGELVYVGHSGGGIPDEQRKKLRDRLAKLERKSSPFKVEPKPNASVHWVRPELICEMSFTEWTEDGSMRHPVFEGLRVDKKAVNVRREKPKSVAVAKEASTAAAKAAALSTASPESASSSLELTHLEKVFFPKHHYTKRDMIAYYEAVADFILPYLKDRPCSLNRMPDGIKGPSFYQKNNEHLPAWVPHADIFSDSHNANLRWIVGGDLDTLKYMVQLGCVEINPWNSRVGRLDNPDWLVIDLDPEGVTFKDVVSVARTVHEICEEWKIPAYPKTSGKTGIHIFIPTAAKYSNDQVRNVAHLLVLEVNKRQPKLTSVERMPAKRQHKIYLDFLQNRQGQTLAAPYSIRPTPDASVSMPLHWDEVVLSLKPTDFTIQNAQKRLSRTGDLWKPVLGPGIDLASILKHLESH